MSGLLDTNSRLICPTERTINRIFKPVPDTSQTSRYLNHKNGMEHGKITFPAILPVFYDTNHFVKFLWVVLPGWGRLYLFRYNSQILEA